MFQYILYFFIALFAASAGSITGMGGGVIVKPILDFMGHYDIETIGMLSTVTVFSMSIVSVLRQLSNGLKVAPTIAIPMAAGSVLGGAIGQVLLTEIIGTVSSKGMVTVVQNAILVLLILVVYIYMQRRTYIKGLELHGFFSAASAGILLGVISSFLSIGGGPINVAFIIFVFSFDIKTAAVYSLITIFFSQASKLTGVLVSTGFDGFTLTMLPPMVAGAIAGGFIGSEFSKHLSEKTIEICFNSIQFFVLIVSLFNIVKNLYGW